MKEYFLEELLQIKNGRDHKHLPDGNIPVFGSGGLMRFVNQSIYNEESILLPRKGTLNNIQFVDKPFWTVDTIYYSVINKERANPLYLYYYLTQLDLSSLNTGTGVPSMTFGAYYKVKVNLPPLPIQQRIAHILSTLDAKIELNNRINSQLEAMAKTIYDYWFVQFDFPDANGKPYKSSGGKMVWNDELKREVPEGWEVGTFGKYAMLKGGFAFKSEWWSNKGLPVIKIKDINENYTLSVENCDFVNEDKYEIAKNYEVFNGDVVIALTGATVGKYGIVTSDKKSILVNQRVGFFNLTKDPTSKLPFLINSLIQDYFRKTVFTLASGAAQPNISTTQIDEIPLLLPTSNLIELYNTKMKSSYLTIIQNQQQNQQLSSLRDWLLPMLMNGQVSVRE
jgi:type I restriction enzyme S subunit